MQPLLECVPNFSEGRDLNIIEQIATAIRSVDGVKLLHVDIGASVNRTVMTFAGLPESVLEAAFQAIRTAADHIDMRLHTGTHPRMGATDVCPLIPLQDISMEETITYAQKLGKRVGEELGIPVYLYEKSAERPERKNLATIRAGEYEGFREKIQLAEWQPDYGPAHFNARAGQTVIGARDFLIAYNINLDTDSVKLANAVAFDIREIGRAKKKDGIVVRDALGKAIREPGMCRFVKAIGWYVEEYGIAQVSCNLTDIHETPIHSVFEAAKKAATARGLKITGSELIGMVPLICMLDAAEFYKVQNGIQDELSETERIQLAVRSLGLDDLASFDPLEKIISYKLNAI